MNKGEIIIDTAIQLFNENGFHGTATSKIAQEAGVANGTLFQYFKTKEKLIVAIFISIKDEMKEHLENNLTATANVKEVMKSQILLSLTWALDHPKKFEYLQQFHTSPYYKQVEKDVLDEYVEPHVRIIQQAIDEELIKSLPVDMIYALISSHTYGLYQFIQSKNYTKQEQQNVIQTGFDLLWNMLT